MHIESIILKEIGPFADVDISLAPGTDPNLADVYLFTGPNGSGKSTALYAIAGCIAGGQMDLGPDHGAQRLWSEDSVAAIKVGESYRAVASPTGSIREPTEIPNPFSHGKLRRYRGGRPGYYQSHDDHPIHSYSQQTHNFRIASTANGRPTFSWAAFAYAGMRSVSDVRLTAIQEPKDSPFENSLSFIETANTDSLAQWIANQEFKRLKAQEAGRHERASQLKQSIHDIEQVVAEIVGEDFAFAISDEDNNVRIRQNGKVVDMGVLPDGLKSIVSWVADLLMRLDRIPWVDDTPPLERQLLLLLDEVDVHLHPSWQRKVLPIVQRMFPKAQIIASTHSPFVVASVDDAQIISLELKNGIAQVENVVSSQAGISYSAVLRSIFGIDSEFDIDTERLFQQFHETRHALLSGATADRTTIQQLADKLSQRSEEVKELVAIELRQMDRQLVQRGAK